MNAQRKLLFALCAAILLFLTIGYVGFKPNATDYPAYLSFSADRDGTKALKLLFESKGNAVKEWRQSWRFLPQTQRQALVVIEPDSLQPGEQAAILDWIEQGNDLILFQQDPSDWEEQFATAERVVPGSYWRYVEQPGTGEDFRGKAVVDATVRLAKADDVTVLLQDNQGILAAKRKIGKGNMLLFLTPEWLQNKNILEHDHFALLWPYLQAKYTAVWFDEFHHGYRQQPGLLAVYPQWLLFLTAQIAVAGLLWIWRKGKRFGPVYTRREWVVRRGDETLLAVAGWYEHRRLARDACRHQAQYMRRLFQEKWGLSSKASDQDIISMARMHWDERTALRLKGLLTHLQEMENRKRYGKDELLHDSRWMDEMISRLEKE